MAEGWRRLEDCPDFLILDVNLPDGSGLDVLRRIRENGLPIRVAVATGSPQRSIAVELDELRPEAILWKPYGSADVLRFLNVKAVA